MTKSEIKTLAESDQQLCWWCAVLFGEICELVAYQRNQSGLTPEEAYRFIARKADEFERIVLAHSVKRAEGEVTQVADLAARVEAIERRLGMRE